MSGASADGPRCAWCERPLRDEASIRRGYGPDCWASMHGRPRRRRGVGYAPTRDQQRLETAAALFDDLEG